MDSLARRHICVYSQGGMLEEKTQSPLVVSAASGVCASSPNKAFLRPHLFFAHSTAIFLSNILHILFILYTYPLYQVFSRVVAHCSMKSKAARCCDHIYISYISCIFSSIVAHYNQQYQSKAARCCDQALPSKLPSLVVV